MTHANGRVAAETILECVPQKEMDCRTVGIARERNRKKKKTKGTPASIKTIWRTLKPDRSDKEKTKQSETKCFSFFPCGVSLWRPAHDILAINPSTLSLIRIRILLEGAATAICPLSNKTHILGKIKVLPGNYFLFFPVYYPTVFIVLAAWKNQKIDGVF